MPNVLTTNWNQALYNQATTFQDVKTGVQVTIPANRPTEVRAMYDAVAAGAYTVVA